MNLLSYSRILSLGHVPAGPSLRRACVLFAMLALCMALAGHAQKKDTDPGLIAHEWGTFTSIAGDAGQAVEWFPLNSPTDLPSFVEHFRGTNFKIGLGGTLRMETPVLYFYSTHDTTVSVRVSFFHGLITEWYPHANKIEPSASLNNVALFQQKSSGSIAWNAVGIRATGEAVYPRDSQSSHYYAARGTSASPLRVATNSGDQQEKFLFYRGVSVAPPPLSALVLPGGHIEVLNQAGDEIPKLILFDRRGEKIGYREIIDLREGAVLDPPNLGASLDSLLTNFASSLTSAGLYPEEAHAMLESWKDSWFEEGSRLIYIVPRAFVDRILPLTIEPQPAGMQRVFVGRMELVTPTTQRAIETALVSHDDATLAKYGRFLAPILETMIHKDPDLARTTELRQALGKIYGSYVAQNTANRPGPF
jgi:hypothetical protein